VYCLRKSPLPLLLIDRKEFHAARWPTSGLVSMPASSSSPTEKATLGMSVALTPWLPSSLLNGTLASPLMVETTAVFLPAEPNFLISDTMVCQSECPNGVHLIMMSESATPFCLR